jgi:WD40-like Beta Propeller Repeat
VRVWKRGGLGSFALVSCAVALLLGGLSGSAQATFPGARGTIVFIDLHNRLDTINTDGTGLAVLRGESFYAQPEGPAWSPDGRYVTWAQAPDRDVGPHLKDIGVINVETGDWHWLTTTGRELVGDSFAPAWSHWGYITFTYRRYDNRDGPADGTYQTYLDGTRPTLYKAGPEMRAAPVPFGRRALFAFIRDGALYVSDETNGTLDGTQVADGPIWDFDWSPDGRRIAYTTGPPYTSTDWHIWIVDADGTNGRSWRRASRRAGRRTARRSSSPPSRGSRSSTRAGGLGCATSSTRRPARSSRVGRRTGNRCTPPLRPSLSRPTWA